MEKKKLYISAAISIILAGLVLSTSIYLIKSLDNKEKIENEANFTNATYVNDGKISTTTTTTNKIISTTANNVSTTTTVKTTTTQKNKTTTTTTTTTTKKTKATKTTTSVKYSEEDVVNYAKTTYTSLKEEKKIKDKVKESFITLVDFIFYDGEILGHKFKDLTDSAKRKIVYYTLKADKFIDEKVPDYKDKMRVKTANLKSKLVAKYMDVTTKLCEKKQDACNEAKLDLEELKKDVKISWKFISSSVKYGAGKAKDIIKSWYEVFSGKV